MENEIKELILRYPRLEGIADEIQVASDLMVDCYKSGGKILVCGNGGSCADSDHIVGELMKGFMLKRPVTESEAQKLQDGLGEEAERYISQLQRAIPAISLPAQSALLTAWANDNDPELVYAQLVFGYARKNDLLMCLSTSGNSKNVVAAAKVAKALGVKVLALTGASESELSKVCDLTLRVPETETFKVQELHLPIYHFLCAEAEKQLFS